MKSLLCLAAILLDACAGGGGYSGGDYPLPIYHTSDYVPYHHAESGSDPSLIFHGDGRPADMYFHDGTGGGILFHGDGQPADLIF